MSYLQSTNLEETIVALSTPVGVGAIGVIRISGAKALEIVQSVFKGKKLEVQQSHTVVFGRILDAEEVLDEVVIAIFRGPNSYTGEDTLEISCHGSPYILQRTIELLVSKGARPAKAGEFTLRAFLNGKLNLSEAEAVADLIHAEDATRHKLAMNQMRGGLTNKIHALKEQFVRLLGLVELELDFSEEDVEFADRSELETLLHHLDQELRALLNAYALGNVLKKGVPTAIVGRPNAGKSTLLNAFVQEERAIVSDIAGTTRDTIEEVWNIQGISFRLIDTAGIRETSDTIEKIGVEKSLENVAKAQLVLYVFDATELTQEEVNEDLEKYIPQGIHSILVANKIDAIESASPPNWYNNLSNCIPLSAKDKTGLLSLENAMVASVTGETSADSEIFANARHTHLLSNCLLALQAIQEGLSFDLESDLLASHMRECLGYLAELTGTDIGHEDVLTYIFSNFCIGK